jgi:hypothetical protein
MVNGLIPSGSPNRMARNRSRHDVLVRWFGGGDQEQRNRLGLRRLLTPKKLVTWPIYHGHSGMIPHHVSKSPCVDFSLCNPMVLEIDLGIASSSTGQYCVEV